MEIIDLTNDFYLVKFSAITNYEFALTSGPWLLYDHYFTVSLWDLDFDTNDTKIEKVAMWVKLPRIFMEYFDENFLTFSRKLDC